jgi:hypothetical protein
MALVIAFVLVIVASGSQAEEVSTHKMLFRDYSITEAPGVGALSAGVASWTDEDNDFDVGGYLDLKFLMLFEEKMNIGVGMVVKSPHADAHYRMDVRLETSLTSHWFDCVEVGAWYAPFWSLAGKDDPYGLMVGYYWKF